jgi:hypothetical protein
MLNFCDNQNNPVCRCYPLDLIYGLPHVYNVIETIETGDEVKSFVSKWDVFRHRSEVPHVMRRRAELAVFIRQWIKSYANGRLVSPLQAAHRGHTQRRESSCHCT